MRPEDLGITPEDLETRKGSVIIDYNRGRWIPCPLEFTGTQTRESWAATYARGWWSTSGLKHRDRQVRKLTEVLAAMQGQIQDNLVCHIAMIHLFDPRDTPLAVGIAIWRAWGGREEQIRVLACAHGPGAIDPPAVEEFPTDNLGPGLRVRYSVRGRADPSAVFGAVNYAWRSEEHETAVRLFTSSGNLGRLGRALPDLDQLARGIRVVPKEQ
jgi:hypothetical protein